MGRDGSPGALSVDGLDVDPDAYYMVKHNLMQNFTYTHEAKLISERVYDHPGSYEYHKLAPEDVVTPATTGTSEAPPVHHHRRRLMTCGPARRRVRW